MSDKEKITIEVEGKPLDFPSADLTANQILKAAQEADIPAARDGIEKLSLKGNESGKIYVGEDRIDLSDDKKFSIGVRVYNFTVNGEKFTSSLQELVALDIVKMAQERGVIPQGDTEHWKLEAKGKSFQGKDLVDLGQFVAFISILNQSTPVA